MMNNKKGTDLYLGQSMQIGHTQQPTHNEVSYCLSTEELEIRSRKHAENVTSLFKVLEKMLTTEAATPEREQVKKEFIKAFIRMEQD